MSADPGTMPAPAAGPGRRLAAVVRGAGPAVPGGAAGRLRAAPDDAGRVRLGRASATPSAARRRPIPRSASPRRSTSATSTTSIPANKQQVGHRLALQARKLAYGETGPGRVRPGPAVGDARRKHRCTCAATSRWWCRPTFRPVGFRAVRRRRRLPVRRTRPIAGDQVRLSDPGRTLPAGQGPLRLGRQPDHQSLRPDRIAGDTVRNGDRTPDG